MGIGRSGLLVMAMTAALGTVPVAAPVADDAPLRLDPVSVTATRNALPAFDYPGMVTVIDREEIETLIPSTADDILRYVPNVEFVGGPRRTGEVPSIRGFSGQDVIILVDGARQNVETGHNGRFWLDPSLLQSVEVLRGPASSLYGSGGTGGVIEFRTAWAADLLAPGETVGGRLSAGWQTAADERVGMASVYARPLAGLDVVGSITSRDSGSIRLGGGAELESASDDIVAGLAKVGYDFAGGHRVEASYQRFSNETVEPANGQGNGSGIDEDKHIDVDNWRAGYSYSDPANKLIDLDAVAYYVRTDIDEFPVDGSPELTQKVETVGLRVDNRSRLSLSDHATVTLTYGGEAYHDAQTATDGGGVRDGVPDAEDTFWGIFGQAEIALTDPSGFLPGEFLIIPGLRYDHFSSSSAISDGNSDGQVSPRIGVSYLPNDWSMVFASYAHAFRAPSIEELYLSGTHFRIPVGAGVTNSFVANPDLKPQRTRTLEVGAGVDFDDVFTAGDRLQVKGSHYRIWGKDFIDLAVDQPAPFVDCNPFIPGACDGTTRAENVASAKLWGTEVEGTYETSRVRVAVGLSSSNGQNEETGGSLGVLQPTQLATDTRLKLPEVDSVVGWRMLAAKEFDKVDDPAEIRDGYAVHGLYASWAPTGGPLQGLRLDLGVDNLFDKSYERVYTSAPEPGRDFKVLVSYALAW